MLMRMLLPLVILMTGAMPATAHEVRPAFLQIRQVDTSTYDFLWKTPAQGDMRLALNVILPSECRAIAEPRTTLVNAAVIQRWRSDCAGGLPGKTVTIEHLQTSLTDVILRFEPLSAAPKTLRITGDAPQAVIPAEQSFREVAATYFFLGIEHILFGFDHLLFVLCLLILVGDFKRLVGAVTAFTLAHSLTLAGTTLGWLRLASVPVEACIALSIAFIAAEIIKTREGRTGAIQRWPWVASFTFGLLHGFGFASALREIGLPDGAVPLALTFFNIGVEAGQLLFIVAVLTVRLGWKTYAPPPPAWAWRIPPHVAGTVACFWFIERSANIFL
jgi:hypothetical protein